MKDDILNELKNDLLNADLDVRKSGNGRWIDQKCTPDVVCAVADILDTLSQEKNAGYAFSCKEVWFSEYSRQFILDIFNKSDPYSKKSVAEYNKFYQQPLNLLAYAGILRRGKRGRENTYEIISPKKLEFIGMSERNALKFLLIYIKIVLRQSDLYETFDTFLSEQSEETFFNMKKNFARFCHKYTKIKKDFEPARIFSKIINPLANEKHKLGTYRGRLSKEIIGFSDLMYNKQNFRDIFANKPKEISRQEWLEKNPIESTLEAKYKADSRKAKKYIHRFNETYFDNLSEYNDEFSIGEATNVHHIFPEHSYKEISGYLENLIALTPTQHFTKAHPKNITGIIDTSYQELLLKAKAARIKYVIDHKEIEQIYSFERFAHVLNIGFDDEEHDESLYANYNAAMNKIELHYCKNI